MPRWADGTARVTVWEIRTLPALFLRKPTQRVGFRACMVRLALIYLGEETTAMRIHIYQIDAFLETGIE